MVETYNSGDIWLANGSFRYHDGRPGFSQPHTTFEDIRQKPFTLSHLRTWKVFLWRSIKPVDLKDSEGNNWEIACDLAFMFPMVEMAGEKLKTHFPLQSNDTNEITNEISIGN